MIVRCLHTLQLYLDLLTNQKIRKNLILDLKLTELSIREAIKEIRDFHVMKWKLDIVWSTSCHYGAKQNLWTRSTKPYNVSDPSFRGNKNVVNHGLPFKACHQWNSSLSKLLQNNLLEMANQSRPLMLPLAWASRPSNLPLSRNFIFWIHISNI